MLRIAWSCGDVTGTEALAPGARFVVARRMGLPEGRAVAHERIDGSAYVFVRLPYVSDPAVVVTATEAHPVVYRGQRANGAVVELVGPTGVATTPEPRQRFTVTGSGSRLEVRYPDLTVRLAIEFEPGDGLPAGSGTEQLGVGTLQSDDAWLVGAVAVALSPAHGVVAHGELKRAFAAWRGAPEMSTGTFERNVLRPALESRGIEPPGARLNKIVYLVEWCRRTAEFPEHVLREVRARLPDVGEQDR